MFVSAPLLYADRVHTTVLWRKLLHRHLVARVRIEGPKVMIARNHKEKAKKAGPGLAEQLQDMSPLLVDRVEVLDGELLFAESPAKDAPRIPPSMSGVQFTLQFQVAR
jgi:hypothetical protein